MAAAAKSNSSLVDDFIEKVNSDLKIIIKNDPPIVSTPKIVGSVSLMLQAILLLKNEVLSRELQSRLEDLVIQYIPYCDDYDVVFYANSDRPIITHYTNLKEKGFVKDTKGDPYKTPSPDDMKKGVKMKYTSDGNEIKIDYIGINTSSLTASDPLNPDKFTGFNDESSEIYEYDSDGAEIQLEKVYKLGKIYNKDYNANNNNNLHNNNENRQKEKQKLKETKTNIKRDIYRILAGFYPKINVDRYSDYESPAKLRKLTLRTGSPKTPSTPKPPRTPRTPSPSPRTPLRLAFSGGSYKRKTMKKKTMKKNKN
jgi:hypothetical protein